VAACKGRVFARTWAVGLVLCVSAANGGASAEAQTVTATTGAVNGVAIDSTKAVVPGVAVTLSGPSLMTTRNALSDEAGAYRFSAVPLGDYTLTFQRSGFGKLVREGIHVGLGFTATVNVELSPATIDDSVTVSGAAPVVDVSSTAVTTHFDSEKLATLPGARDFFAIAANTPGVALSKMDVGGNGALSLQEYIAYGLRATTGVNRNEVEGIRVGGANGANDNYFSDFASFSEIAITAVGQTAAMPVPGTLGQYVSKSGGNAYHGGLYADFQNDALEATNIDDSQIARGVSGGPGLDARDVNRLQRFRDFNADVGGYLKKNQAWWYGAYRSTELAQQYPWLLDAAATLDATVVTGKVTFLLSRRQKLVGYLQHETFRQLNYFTASTSQPILTSDGLQRAVFPVSVWKGEYNAAVTDAFYVEARVGGYRSDFAATFKSTDPRIADIGANTVRGGAVSQQRLINRPQANGSMSFLKTGWGGSHTFRIGGEYMNDQLVAPTDGYGNPCNCLSTLNNGAPAQVQIRLGPNVSKNALTTAAGFVDDAWRLNGRVTISLGLRLDRYQPILPEQQGPAGQTFAAIDPVLTFNNWAPRVGMSADLGGDGKTVLKLHYGQFWVYPGTNFTSAFNPNPSGWSQTYAWTNDANASGRWDPGEEGRLLAVSGGSTSTRLDPDIENTNVRQASAYIEREVAPDFGVRTGMVLNAKRQPYGTINVSRPLDAYSVPVPVVDPGPDGRLGSADDGGPVAAYNLTAASLAASPVNLTTNLPDSNSEYYTWEIAATKRQRTGWSLLASFTETWSHEAALGTGNDFTPNALINAAGTQDRFRTWQAKLNGTMKLRWGFLLVPVVRHQSGTPFARTFVQTLNYGNATIKAEPIAANRTPDITLVDVRTEKTVRVKAVRVMGFFDVYNIFNTNAAQTLTTTSGGSWLRPTAITAPRVLRIGARLQW
jgi:hypothetical protein